jgi:hypothetical protein
MASHATVVGKQTNQTDYLKSTNWYLMTLFRMLSISARSYQIRLVATLVKNLEKYAIKSTLYKIWFMGHV